MNRQPKLAPRAQQERNLMICRTNTLLMTVITLINVILLAVGADTYFLFSATVPYYLTMYGLLFTGKLPVEFYGGEAEYALWEFLDPAFLYITLAIVAVIIAAYAILWFFSKKHSGCLVAFTVLFGIDTLYLLYNVVMFGFGDFIFDILMHAWVFYYLIIGLIAVKKLKDMPLDEVPAATVYVGESAEVDARSGESSPETPAPAEEPKADSEQDKTE